MSKELNWINAIIVTLGLHKECFMHYKKIWEFINDNTLYNPDGETPDRTVASYLSQNPDLFETKKKGSGEYRLTDEGLKKFDELKHLTTGLGTIKEVAKPITKVIKDPQIESYVTLLKANHNIILHGAPGTGKTYLAKKIAKALYATKENGRFEMVQFHPSYDYTDFVEGLRPKSDGKGNIVFERKDGVFKAFCKRALTGSTIGTISGTITGPTKITAYIYRFLKPAWDSLITDLDSGIISDLPNKERGRTIQLHANKKDKNRIDFYTKKGQLSDAHWATFDGILNIHKEFGCPSAIVKVEDIRKVCKGSQTSTLWAIYNEVYNRAIELANLDYPGNTNLTSEVQRIEANSNGECLKYIFLIDEINRGDMSKIFGELFFSIDPGYRGVDGRINTQYQNMLEGSDEFKEGFYIPENVYIIGTMNDIDRSVETMDFAMRRRFQFIEVTAENRAEGMKLKEKKEGGDEYKETEAYKRMTNLNNCIISEDIGLSTAYQIGGAYFMKKVGSESKPITSDDEFKDLWDYRLKGLLREYLRGDDDIDKKIEKLRDAFFEGCKVKATTNQDATESDAEQETVTTEVSSDQ